MKALNNQVLHLFFPLVLGAFIIQIIAVVYQWNNLQTIVFISCLFFILIMYNLGTINRLAWNVSYLIAGILLCFLYVGGSIGSIYMEEPFQEITPFSTVAYGAEENTKKTYSFLPTKTVQKDVVSMQIDSISYYFSEDNIASVEEYSSMLAREKANLDRIFGTELKDPLTIEIYNDSTAIKKVSPGAVGYYKRKNQSIHLMKMDDEKRWERILLHEYTHYRIHQFAKVNGLSSKMEQLPFWFIEGLSEYVGYQDRMINQDILGETVDYRLLDSSKTIPDSLEHYKVYLQGYFTIKKLDSLYGSETIKELLLSESLTDFYNTLERVTNKSTEEFQKTLLANY